jgi:outer membrane protein OmpA-like peptidoglycan-associated protein
MISVRKRTFCLAGMSIGCLLATSGCASKKYVNMQMAAVNQKNNQYQKQTNGRIAWLTNKEQSDVSQLNNRLATTDQNLSQVSAALQSAQATASRAVEESEPAKPESVTANPANYQLVDKADVMFGFNKATLTPAARTKLDEVAAKFQSMPRGVVELAGFTDRSGSANYNLELSRRRAWAVQRYLVEHDVPMRSIHMVGMGEAAPPDGLKAESQPERARGADRDQFERRVDIRVYGTGESTGSGGSR